MMSTKDRFCRISLLPFLSLIGSVALAQEQAPPKSWIDPDTGHRVLRITDEPNSASLYFNDNAYTSDGKSMVYTTPHGISVVDLQTFKSRPVVEGKVRVIVAGAKTQNVYYINMTDHALYATDVDTRQTRKVASLPARNQIGLATVNADETLAAGTYIEGDGYQYG